MDSLPSLVVHCRFVALDLWFTTRVNLGWKIEDVKSALLSKCFDETTPRELARPPSPITFAPDPRRRPISPITFAPSVTGKRQGGVQSADASADESMGYEEDDEWDGAYDSDDSEPGKLRSITHQYRHHFQTHQHVTSLVSAAPISKLPPCNPSTVAHSITADSDVSPRNYKIVRYSTGQILEDPFTLSMYQINPYELLELHRTGVVLRLSRHSISDYIQPYFEARVQALRFVRRDDARDFPATKDGSFGRGSDSKSSKQKYKLEWRERWVVIQNGMLSLCTSRDDKLPVQAVSLNDLITLRGPEHLKHTNGALKPGERIVCAQFRRNLPTTTSGAGTRAEAVDKGKGKAKDAPQMSGRPKPTLKLKPTTTNPNTGPYLRSLSRSNPRSPTTPMPTSPVPKSVAHGGGSQDWNDSSPPSSPVFAPVGDFMEASGKYEPGSMQDDRYDSDIGPRPKQHQHSGKAHVIRKNRSHEVHVKAIGDMAKDERAKPRSDSDLKGKRKAVEIMDAERDDNAEWIVLSFGDAAIKDYHDSAFSSILRILHRQATEHVPSAFVAAHFGTSTPMPTPTPFPSPTSARPIWGDDETQVSSRLSRSSSTSSSGESPPDLSNQRRPRHPPSLAALTDSLVSRNRRNDTYGALPYPEWRKHATMKARTAGIGDVGPALALLLAGADPDSSPVTIPRTRKHSENDHNTMVEPNVLELDDASESEAEWHAWMGDLRRQRQQGAEDRVKAAQEATEDTSQAHPGQSDTRLLNRTYLQDRLALEPSGVVSSQSMPSPIPTRETSPPPLMCGSPGATSAVPNTLSSPSSTESMFRRAKASNFNQFGYSSTSGPSASNASNNTSTVGSSSTRRPSMPPLPVSPLVHSPESTISSKSSSTHSIQSSGLSVPPKPMGVTSTVTVVGKAPLPRRSSSASTSIARTGSVLTKAFGRRREDSSRDKTEKEQTKEEAKRAKEAEKRHKDNANASDDTPMSPQQSRRLSITPDSNPAESSRPLPRHVRSRSSLHNEAVAVEVIEPMPSTNKWAFNKEKIFNNFAPAIDFVNGK